MSVISWTRHILAIANDFFSSLKLLIVCPVCWQTIQHIWNPFREMFKAVKMAMEHKVLFWFCDFSYTIVRRLFACLMFMCSWLRLHETSVKKWRERERKTSRIKDKTFWDKLAISSRFRNVLCYQNASIQWATTKKKREL